MASLVSTSTKIIFDTMAGAPVLNNAAGSAIALLDAVLVTGFGIKSITSLVIAGGVATIGFAAPASAAAPEAVILLAGITGTYAALNGEQRVKTVSTTSATFLTDMPDGTATLSSATFKIAPLGWEKIYTGTNKAVFRPLDPASSRPYLRVLDTAAAPASAFSARVHMFESMTDVDTGTNQSPTTTNLANGNYWWKTNANTSAAQAWSLVGDSRGFYFAPCTHFSGSSTLGSTIHYFGDIKPYKPGDPYCGVLLAAISEVNATPSGTVQQGSNSATSFIGHIMRSHTGLGNSRVLAWRGLASTSTAGVSGADTAGLGPFPAQANNGMILCDIVLGHAPLETNGPRGVFPGVAYMPQSGANNNQFSRGGFVDGSGVYAGVKLMSLIGGGTLSSSGQDFPIFFDVTRDWRA